MLIVDTREIILVIFGIWLFGVTVGLVVVSKFFLKIRKQGHEIDLNKILDKIINDQQDSRDNINKLKKDLELTIGQGVSHIQKVGLVRFNPFNETGGDHSFSLAILDGGSTGVIITTLHSRERTRIYAKHLKNGKSDTELSKEENRALAIALKS